MQTERYRAAMAKSYSNQEGGITIPAAELDGIVEIPMGSQPLGISSQVVDNPEGEGQVDQIMMAFYFEPSICLADVTRDEKGLHFQVSHIRGVDHGIRSVRLFPELWKEGDANRAQTVIPGMQKTLWVSRNGARTFYVLTPPEVKKGRWRLTAELKLPPIKGMGMLHAASWADAAQRLLTTIESKNDLTAWHQCSYHFDGEFKLIATQPLPQWTYGIGAKNEDHRYLVRDYRCEAGQGIVDWNRDEVVVEGVWGNGIAFLSNGAALVTVYGQSEPGAFNGSPGRLIYVPARFFANQG